MSDDSSRPFASDQAQELAAVLDTLIPPSEDGRMPGAGALGLVRRLEEICEAGADLRPILEGGLTALSALARERGAGSFAGLCEDERPALLEAVGEHAPAFVPTLLFHTYAGYYQHPKVLEGLGLPARAPFPQGYPLEAGDLGPLERVQARGRLWRETGESDA